MDRSLVLTRVKKTISELYGIQVSTMEESDEISKDMGIDSLDLIELCMALDSYYKIEIKEEEYKSMTTLKDLVDCVCTLVTIQSPNTVTSWG